MFKVTGFYKDSEKSTTLEKVQLKAYWANEDGNKIDKGNLDSIIRLYIEEYWAYDVFLKIFFELNTNEKIVILEGMLSKLIPAYFVKEKNFLEINPKQYLDTDDFFNIKEVKLCCSISDGFGYFYEAKITSVTLSLNLCNKCSCCIVDEKYFFEQYLIYFKDSSVYNHIKFILEEYQKYHNLQINKCQKSELAYILATIKKETGATYIPVIEYNYAKSYEIRKKYYEKMYDPQLGKNAIRRKMAMMNGNTEIGDGVKYAGRGYVQITWKNNYRKFASELGIDLVKKPDLALDPSISIKIALIGFYKGLFTGKKLSDFFTENKKDYYNARRIINGLDCAEEIKSDAEKFEKCLLNPTI